LIQNNKSTFIKFKWLRLFALAIFTIERDEMKCSFMDLLFDISAWISAAAALLLGLVGLMQGRNVVEEFLVNNGMVALISPLHYLFGIAGILFVVSLITRRMGCACRVS